jgi:hypothetical protein
MQPLDEIDREILADREAGIDPTHTAYRLGITHSEVYRRMVTPQYRAARLERSIAKRKDGGRHEYEGDAAADELTLPPELQTVVRIITAKINEERCTIESLITERIP